MSAGVNARAHQRSAMVPQGSCWSTLRRSVAARLLPDGPSWSFDTTTLIAYSHRSQLLGGSSTALGCDLVLEVGQVQASAHSGSEGSGGEGVSSTAAVTLLGRMVTVS